MKISVVIPAFNNHRALMRSMESLANQTLKPIEVIIVDDGSYPRLINNWGPWVRMFRIKRYPSMRGSSEAKNLGMEKARGDYISFCDSDILHMPDALESLAARMAMWESEGRNDVLLNSCRVSLPKDYPDDYMKDMERLWTACETAEMMSDPAITHPYVSFEQNESLARADFIRRYPYDALNFPSWGFNNQDLCTRIVDNRGIVSSAIPRVSNKKRLHCFHMFHENNCDREQAQREFVDKWGEPWSNEFFHKMQMKRVNESNTRDAAAVN